VLGVGIIFGIIPSPAHRSDLFSSDVNQHSQEL
jgi:hypothetical protein